MGPELRTGLTSAHLVQLAFPALQDLPLLAPPPERSFTELIVAPEVALTKLPSTNGALAARTDPISVGLPCLAGLAAARTTARAFFHRTDRSAGSGAHEIALNQWRPGRQDRSGSGVVAQPSAMFLRVPGALVVQVRTATSRAEEQFARFGLGRAPSPRSQLPGEARNPGRPGDYRRRDRVSRSLDGTGPRRSSPSTRARETCAGWGNGWSPSTWTRWPPPWNPPPSNSMYRARSPASRSGDGWMCWTWKGG